MRISAHASPIFVWGSLPPTSRWNTMGAGASAIAEAPLDTRELRDPENATRAAIVGRLVALCKAEPAAYATMIANVAFQCRETRCGLPPLLVADIAPVPEADRAAFEEAHVSRAYLHDGPEAEERYKNSTEIQYARWQWATRNASTYVNVMRAAGHGDAAIQGVFDGRPLCWKDAALWAEFCAACGALERALAAEQGWTFVRTIHTGSAVPGFSQNPAKGHRDLPSKITDPAKFDVDVCVSANGVNRAFARLEDDDSKRTKRYPSTTGFYNRGMRFAVKFDMALFSEAVAEFHRTWSAKLPGGLQITFAEDDQPIPPWEMYVPSAT